MEEKTTLSPRTVDLLLRAGEIRHDLRVLSCRFVALLREYEDAVTRQIAADLEEDFERGLWEIEALLPCVIAPVIDDEAEKMTCEKLKIHNLRK